MTANTVLALYSAIIVAVLLLGGWLPSKVKLTHTGTQVIMSFVAGLMLGIAFYHLLPHAIFTLPEQGGVDTAHLVVNDRSAVYVCIAASISFS